MPITQQRTLLEGEEVEIFKLVSKGATTKQWAEWLRVPLEHAAASGDFDLVDRLIKAGANGSSGWKGCRRRTLLDAATFGGNVDVVSALLQAGCGPDVNKVPSSSKRSALYQSIVGKHESVARCLIIAGADVNYEDPTDRCTPLYAAAVTARQDGLVRDLLIAGACPNARAGYRRRTPLHGAAELGLDRIVSVLLGTPSTDKDALDDRGYSPLMLASRHGDVTTVDNLLHAGADLTLRSHFFHDSALDMAAQEGYVGVMKALLDHGADLSAAGGAWSALHNAALMDEVDSVRVLLDAGADVNCKDSESGETPLHIAAKHRSDAALLVLLRRGADPNEKTSDGDAALHLTASGDGRHIAKTVDLLLRWGASEQALGGEGKTTAQLLQRLKHEGEGEWEMDELEPALELLASAPADRTWRRRCWLVMLRARADRDRMNRRSNRLRSQRGGISGQDGHGGRRIEDSTKVKQGKASSGGRARSQRPGPGIGVELRGLVEVLLGLESDGVFRAVVGYL